MQRPVVLVTHSDWANAFNKRVNEAKWKCEVIAHPSERERCGWLLFSLNERHFRIESFWIRYANLTLFYRISFEYFEGTNFSYSNDNSEHQHSESSPFFYRSEWLPSADWINLCFSKIRLLCPSRTRVPESTSNTETPLQWIASFQNMKLVCAHTTNDATHELFLLFITIIVCKL